MMRALSNSRSLIVAAAVFAGVGCASASRAASAYDDDFNDGVPGPQWTVKTDPIGTLSIAESGGTLNVLSAMNTNSHADAIYLSTFRISTAEDFTLQADYSFASFDLPAPQPGGGGVLRAMVVDFGVGTDSSGYNSAAIGQGFGSFKNPLTGAIVATPGEAVAYRTNDQQTTLTPPLLTGTPTGQFLIAYNAAADALTFSEIGGSSYTLSNTVRGVWNASSLLVSLGGRGDSEFSTTGSEAHLDNFTIIDGTVVVPEPACFAVFAAGAALLRRQRR